MSTRIIRPDGTIGRDLDEPIDVSHMKKFKKRERTFESQLRDALHSQRVKFVKTKPTITGFPDRLAIGHGSMKLCELKAEDEELRRAQEVRHEELLRDYGVEVLVFDRDVSRSVLKILDALLS